MVCGRLSGRFRDLPDRMKEAKAKGFCLWAMKILERKAG